jgi:hypothetical protein
MKNFLKYIFLFLFIWGFYCPKGHICYYLKEPFKSNEIVKASNFYVDNFGYFDKGIYTPMTWGNPRSGEIAKCPICGEMLRFESKYQKEIN